MFRFAIFLAAVALAALPITASAQPLGLGSFQVVDAHVVKGKLRWSETKAVPLTKEIAVEVEVNGVKRQEKRQITVFEQITLTREVGLKELKATDGAGKAIDAEKLAEMLKEETPIVVTTGPLPEKHRKLFKDSTVFVQLPAPKLPGGLPPPPPPPVLQPAPN